MSETPLIGLARQRVCTGDLPPCEPTALFAGFGSGGLCALCDRPISEAQIEYEVELQGMPGRAWPLHLECYRVWRSVCDAVMED